MIEVSSIAGIGKAAAVVLVGVRVVAAIQQHVSRGEREYGIVRKTGPPLKEREEFRRLQIREFESGSNDIACNGSEHAAILPRFPGRNRFSKSPARLNSTESNTVLQESLENRHTRQLKLEIFVFL